MNLGLRDAVCLGSVLAEHLTRSTVTATDASRDELAAPLKAWAAWRHKQALTVIGLTKKMLTVATLQDKVTWHYGCIPVNWVRVRNFVLWSGGVTGIARKKVAWRLSGLGTR